MAIITYSDISSLLPDIWEGALMVARDQTIMASLVRNFNGQGLVPRKSTIYGTVTFTTVSETDNVVAQTYTRSAKQTLTPGEIAASFFLSDSRIESDDQDIVGDASRELGMGAAQKIEADIISQSGSVAGGTVGTNAGTLTWGHLLAAQSVLRAANAPMPYLAVLHPYQYHNLAKAQTVAAATQPSFASSLTDRLVSNFYVQTAYGIDIFVTSNIPISSSAASGVLMNRDALALDVRRPLRLELEREASRRGWEIVASAVYAYGLWRPEWGVTLAGTCVAPTS